MKTEIYYNVTTGECFDRDGTLRTVNNPFTVSYGEKRTLEWHLMSFTNPELPLSEWTPWTEWELVPAIACSAADDNFISAFRGVLRDAVSGGASAIAVAIDTGDEEIAPQGRLRFFRNDGSSAELVYTAVNAVSEGYVFAVEIPADEEGFTAGIQVDVIQEPLICSDKFRRDLSDPANGIFVFDLSVSGWRLSRKMEYEDTESIMTKGVELNISGIESSGLEQTLLRCLAPLQIKGVLYLSGSNQSVAGQNLSDIQEWVLGLFANGIDVEYQTSSGEWSTDSTGAAAFRWRISGPVSMPWSPAVPL